MEPTENVNFTDRGDGVVTLKGPAATLTVGSEHRVLNKGNGRIYGPYRVAWASEPSPNKDCTVLAYKVSAGPAGKTVDQLTKAELIQLIAQLTAKEQPAAPAPAKNGRQ